jgi:hypothetical protein
MGIGVEFWGVMQRARRSRAVAACVLAGLLAGLLAIAGCTTAPPRVPYTQQELAEAVIPGIPGARLWADDPAIATGRRSVVSRSTQAQPTILALSGGGADGAFGAGLLSGWTARGTRPKFTFVTGSSAGALLAPFAFLGPSYDETIKGVFASGEMSNLLQTDAFSALFGASAFKSAPLRELIARHVDPDLLAAIAREHRTGRRLYIVTTNLDAQRTAIWDMGRISESGDPGALELFRNIMAASATVPGVFSPVLIDVEANGQRFAEMHVDGGVTNNVLIVPEAVLVSGTALFPPESRPKVYVVINGKLSPYFEVVQASTLTIVRRSFETSVRANTRNTLLASLQFAKSKGWEFNIASIDSDYPNASGDIFNATYMGQLFNYGYQRGRSGKLFQSTPTEFRAPPRVAVR